MKVAVLGMGQLGRGIASRLLDRGYSVTVWNRTPGKANDVVDRGAREATSIADAIRGVAVAVTVLTDDGAVKEVYLGQDGILAALDEGTVVIDMSTVSPETSRLLAEATPDDRFVEAPVLGTPQTTAAGNALCLVAGHASTVHKLESLWIDVAASHIYCGSPGAAATLKLLSNVILITGTAILAEAMVTAQACGIDDDLLRQVFGQNPVVAPAMRPRLDDILNNDFPARFTVALAEKDMRLAMDLAAGVSLSLGVASAASQELAAAANAGHAQDDLSAVTSVTRAQRS